MPIAESTDYRSVVLASNPVAYWRLGESSGMIAVDETPNHRQGRFVGNPEFNQPGAIVGDSNGSITLNGNSFVEIPDDPAFSQPTSGEGLSVEAWLRADDLSFNNYIHWLGKGTSGQMEWGFRLYSKNHDKFPNRVSAYVWNPVGGEGAGAYLTIAAKEWTHVVACFGPGDATVNHAGVQSYKNGVFQNGPPKQWTLYSNSPRWSIMPAHGNAPVRLGTRDHTPGSLVGGLDEIAIYPRVLTAEEIRLHYEVGVRQYRR